MPAVDPTPAAGAGRTAFAAGASISRVHRLPTIVQGLFVAVLPLGVAAVGVLPAQCANQFVPTLQFPGTDGIVRARCV